MKSIAVRLQKYFLLIVVLIHGAIHASGMSAEELRAYAARKAATTPSASASSSCAASSSSSMSRAAKKVNFAITIPQKSNGLLIFLDDSEGFGSSLSVSRGVLEAIYQEVPFVASASLLYNICNFKAEAIDQREILHRYNAQKLFDQDNEETKNTVFSAAAVPTRLVADWVVKEINKQFYLLLPKKYLQQRGISLHDAQQYNANGPLTPIELALGLKVNHMKTEADIKTILLRFNLYASDFVDNLHDIFVTNQEYPMHYKSSIPAWQIYLEGHGGANHSIAGLSLDNFKEFLHFLEIRITTRLLYYLSCYAAGANSATIYRDAKSGIERTYPFAIITQALTDAVTVTTRYMPISLNSQGRLVLSFVHDRFKVFFENTSTQDSIDYQQMIRTMSPVTANRHIGSFPQIKFPGLPWFSVLDIDNRAVSIGSIMAASRTAPLDIVTFFAKRGVKSVPRALLLYTQEVPFEIVLPGVSPMRMVSMIPGDASHHIKKISYFIKKGDAYVIMEDFVNLFLIDLLAPHKIFAIDLLTLDRSKGAPEYHKVIVSLNKSEVIVYYTNQAFGKLRRFKDTYTLGGPLLDEIASHTSMGLDDPYLQGYMEENKKYADLWARYGTKASSVQSAPNGIDKRSIHQLLTPENIAHVADVVQRLPAAHAMAASLAAAVEAHAAAQVSADEEYERQMREDAALAEKLTKQLNPGNVGGDQLTPAQRRTREQQARDDAALAAKLERELNQGNAGGGQLTPEQRRREQQMREDEAVATELGRQLGQGNAGGAQLTPEQRRKREQQMREDAALAAELAKQLNQGH